MKKALITGITGQDGSYLAELLLSKGYEVHGIIRKSSSFNTGRIDPIYKDPHIENTSLFLHYGDLSDASNLSRLIEKIQPDEIYNLAAQSHVKVSFDLPEYTADVNALGTLRLLDAIREARVKTKIYQASTSELYGEALETPQKETTPFNPRSPYGCAKAFAFYITKNYREAYNLFACNGILFNHESPRRGETFLTRKVTMAIAFILTKKKDVVYLGNLSAKRDWGFAPEYVESMWNILQCDQPADYVIGQNETHSVREFVEKAFSYAGLNWAGYVKIDDRYKRPSEVDSLMSDSTKAKESFGWSPKVNFDELVKIMVDADMRKAGLKPIGEGDKVIRKKFPDKWWKGN